MVSWFFKLGTTHVDSFLSSYIKTQTVFYTRLVSANMKLSFVLPVFFAALAVSVPIGTKDANNEIEARGRGCLVCGLFS